jgi:hypothetical protein
VELCRRSDDDVSTEPNPFLILRIPFLILRKNRVSIYPNRNVSLRRFIVRGTVEKQQTRGFTMTNKKARKPRTTGQDLCRCCFSFGCDPMSMSPRFSRKIRDRFKYGLCPACGHALCTCRSSMEAGK